MEPRFEWWCLNPYALIAGGLIWRFVVADRRRYLTQWTPTHSAYFVMLLLAFLTITLLAAYGIQCVVTGVFLSAVVLPFLV